eukprot:scaffold25902_cov60-Phaeocystis_antarctica.AAC.2
MFTGSMPIDLCTAVTRFCVSLWSAVRAFLLPFVPPGGFKKEARSSSMLFKEEEAVPPIRG